jgi:hypothetical protein
MKELFMKITKIDPVLGEKVTLDVPITEEQYQEILNRYITKKYIQDIVPNLAPEYREFIISGISPQSWDKYLDACEEFEIFSKERNL